MGPTLWVWCRWRWSPAERMPQTRPQTHDEDSGGDLDEDGDDEEDIRTYTMLNVMRESMFLSGEIYATTIVFA